MLKKTHIPGIAGDVDPPLNIIIIIIIIIIIRHSVRNSHVADSLEVRFTKFARTVSGIQFLIFDLKNSRDLHSLRSLGKLYENLAPAKHGVPMP